MDIARTLAIIALLFSSGACGSEPCECPATVAASAQADIGVAGVPTVVGDSPRAQLGLETVGQLFAHDFAPVRERFTVALRDDLTDVKLGSIVTGLTQAHGGPVQIMDAWATTVREGEEVMPASQVIIKMANDTRLGLVLVFDAQGAVKGLWLRPV